MRLQWHIDITVYNLSDVHPTDAQALLVRSTHEENAIGLDGGRASIGPAEFSTVDILNAVSGLYKALSCDAHIVRGIMRACIVVNHIVLLREAP